LQRDLACCDRDTRRAGDAHEHDAVAAEARVEEPAGPVAEGEERAVGDDEAPIARREVAEQTTGDDDPPVRLERDRARLRERVRNEVVTTPSPPKPRSSVPSGRYAASATFSPQSRARGAEEAQPATTSPPSGRAAAAFAAAKVPISVRTTPSRPKLPSTEPSGR
jgi:hypothetical protein